MAHYDAVLPGRDRRPSDEALVADTETRVRRFLDYLGLRFDPACLALHLMRRPVSTVSAAQVRQPSMRER